MTTSSLPYSVYEDPRYWSGELTWRPGFVRAAYQDFSGNQVKADYILAMKPQGRVLDAGCAMGFLVRRLRNAGVDAYGLDISKYALEHAPEEVKPYLVNASITEIPYPDRHFDIVTTFGVLEHFEGEELRKVISELVRVSHHRGLMSITLKGDPGAVEEKQHQTLKTLKEWRAILPPQFEIRSDANEEWAKVKQIHSALVIAPVIYPCSGDMRYGGIERLAYYWACELVHRGIQVSVSAARGSRFPKGITHIASPQGDFTQGELVAYGIYRPALSLYDVILDFSHSHYAMREFALPAVCWCWHTPSLMQPLLPSYNVLALSQWQAAQLQTYQNISARVLDCHCGVPLDYIERSDRFVFIGRMTPSKGVMEAIDICESLGVGLDIIGGLGPGDLPEFLFQVQSRCTDKAAWWGEVSDEVKNMLLTRARALIYPISYPPLSGEAHSHKAVDALLAGVPVVAYNQGALPEVIEHGTDGFLARNRAEFASYMLQAEKLDREGIRRRANERWAIPNAVERAFPLLTSVARGLKW